MRDKKPNSESIMEAPAQQGRGQFRDKLTVHTARSGKQYVSLSELLFDKSKIEEYIEELIRKKIPTPRH